MIIQPTLISSTFPVTIDLPLVLSGIGVLISLIGLITTIVQGRRQQRQETAEIEVRGDGSTTFHSGTVRVAIEGRTKSEANEALTPSGHRSREEAEAALLAEIDEVLHRHTGLELDTVTRLRSDRPS